MNSLDIILTIILLIGLIRGLMKGFIYEIALCGTLFLCYFFGFKLAGIASVLINKFIHVDPATLKIISLVVAWIGISVGIFFLAKLFEGLVKIVALGVFNKIGGAIFGLMKYAIIVGVFLFFLNKVNISFSWFNDDLKADSFLYYPLLKMATALFTALTS